MRRQATAFLPLALLLATGCSSSKFDTKQRVDKIVVLKSAHTMTLYSSGQPLKVYKIALGRGRGGAKQREGDHETPEGSYIIDRRVPHVRTLGHGFHASPTPATPLRSTDRRDHRANIQQKIRTPRSVLRRS
jgi:hypothetical protein